MWLYKHIFAAEIAVRVLFLPFDTKKIILDVSLNQYGLFDVSILL